MKPSKIKFIVERDQAYIHAFASGLEVSAMTPERVDISFYYEQVNKPEEFISLMNESGEVHGVSLSHELNSDTLEIKRIVKADISIDIKTAENMITILQEHLKNIIK